MNRSFISLDQITKRFGKTTVLQNLSLEVNESERLVILGPSGCGKTTTLRLIAGLEKPDAGEIYIAGEQVSTARHIVPPDRRDIGMVFQDLALWPHMTVGGNVGFVLRSMTRSDRKARVLETLRLVRMDDRVSSYPHELSGGEQQRVAIARALVSQPKVLLMDEPLSNLDVHLREELRQEICRIQRQLGVTLLYVTHDQEDAMAIADRVAVMNRGKLEQVDAPEEVYHKPKTCFVAGFFGLTNLIPGKIVLPGVVETEIGRIVCDTASCRGINTVTLAFRPELIEITNDGQVEGVVTDRIFKGDRLIYRVSVNGRSIAVQTGDAFSVGDKVGLRFSRQPVVLVEEQEV